MNNILRKKFKTLRRTVRTHCLKYIVACISTLSVRKVPKLAKMLSRAMRIVFKKELKRAAELLPPEFEHNRDDILEGMIKNQVMNVLETLFYEKMLEQDPDFVKVVGIEHLEKALAAGHGAIILTGHFGNWEMVAYAICRLGYKMHVVAKPQAVDQMTDFINSFREKRGEKVLSDKDIGGVLRVLRNNGVVGLLSDLNAREHGYIVPFFGREASFYSSPVIFSQRSGAPLIPTFDRRDDMGRHVVTLEPFVEWDRTAPMHDRVAAYVKRYETAIRSRPDLWVWFHERYKFAETGRRA